MERYNCINVVAAVAVVDDVLAWPCPVLDDGLAAIWRWGRIGIRKFLTRLVTRCCDALCGGCGKGFFLLLLLLLLLLSMMIMMMMKHRLKGRRERFDDPNKEWGDAQL